MKCLLLVAALAIAARAQIPSLGFCPEYLSMANFDMDRFTGIWHEAERYFQLTEVASRCVTSNYTKTPSGKYYVINEVMNRFTGVKRVLEGEIKRSQQKGDEGKLIVKYTTLPVLPFETQYNVLETDYDNYAVLWSCSGVGPVHTQNAWIMTRLRFAAGDIIQKAYGVLDRHKISKVFFVKTNQEDCAYLEEGQTTTATQPPKKPVAVQAPVAVEIIEESDNESEETPAPLAGKSSGEIRPHIVPDTPEVIIQTRKAELEAKEQLAVEPVKTAAIQQPVVEPLQADEGVRSVPEVIMKIADQAKQESETPTVELATDELITKNESPAQEAIAEINKEIPFQQAIAEPEEAVKSPAEEPIAAVTETLKEAASLDKEPVVAEAETTEPEIQPLKKPESIVEEKIEIAQP